MNILDTLQKNRQYVVFGLVGFLVLILVLVLMIPRGTSQGDPAVPLSGDNIRTEIIWWRPFHTKQTYQEVINDFNQTYPNVQVTVVNKPYTDGGRAYYSELVSDIARDAGPDIFMLDDNDLPAYRDFIHPNSLFQGRTLSNYQNSFADLVVKNTIGRDSVYGVATELENLQLYYNKDLLAQNGIALPASTWDQVASQVDDLGRLNSQFQVVQSAIALGHGGTANNRDIGNIEQYSDIIPALLLQSGDIIYDEQTQRSVLGNGEGDSLEALQTYLQFANPRDEAYTWSASLPSNIEFFSSGNLAYMVNYSFTANQIREKNSRLNFAVAPLPQINQNNKKTYGTFFMNSINARLAADAERDGPTSEAARKLKAVENFLYFLSLPEQQARVAQNTGAPSAHLQVLAEQQQEAGDIGVFAEGALYADSYYQPCVSRTEDLWSDLFYNVHYQTGQYTQATSRETAGLTDREIALTNAFRQTRQNYQAILQDGTCTW